MKILLPREHGAWGMLFAPLLVGMFAGGARGYHVLLFLGMLAVYLATYPLIQWVKNPKRNSELKGWIAGYGAAAVVPGLPLLFKYPGLIWLALPAGTLLLVNIRFAIRKKERHMLNDLAAIGGLSFGGVAAYYVGVQAFDLKAWLVWLSCLLLFFGSVLHVKSLIREKGNRAVKTVANLYHAVLVPLPILAQFAYPELLPYKWLALAYAFSAVKVWFTPFHSTVRPLTIGILEIANTVWFVIVASFVFA